MSDVKPYTWRDDQEARVRRLLEAAESGRLQTYGQVRDWARNVLALTPTMQDSLILRLKVEGLDECVRAIRDLETGQHTLTV